VPKDVIRFEVEYAYLHCDVAYKPPVLFAFFQRDVHAGIVTGSLNSVVRARYAVSMPRHESVIDEYIEELKASLKAEAERVRTAPDWPETQKRMVTGLNAYQTALDRAEQGWSRAEIENELGVRTLFEKRPNPIRVIGNRTEEEDNG